jgi:probable phosphoglycerate mutase
MNAQMSNETRLIIVRHGETQANLDGRWQGHGDSPLTKTGIAQAEAVAQRLKQSSFSQLYSSDLGRALQTAQIIADRTGHEIVLDKDLRERHLGIFQGLTRAEMAATYPQEWHLYRTAGPDYVIPEGESARQRFERSTLRLQEIACHHPGETVVIVTHGGVLNGLLRHVLDIPLESPRRFKVWNASLNVFLFNGETWLLETWGDVSHLQGRAALDDA